VIGYSESPPWIMETTYLSKICYYPKKVNELIKLKLLDIYICLLSSLVMLVSSVVNVF